MNERTWHSDSYGLYNLHDGTHHWWITPRQPYCDRGHWEIGYLGLGTFPQHQPARYLHRLDSAIAEVERWHQRLAGHAPAPASMDDAFDALSPAEQAKWAAMGTTFRRKDRQLVLTLTEQATEQGPVWVMTAEGLDDLDDADGFPRAYLTPALAFDEAACFSAWRLDRQPTEVPGKITRAPQVMGGQTAKPVPAKRARARRP